MGLFDWLTGGEEAQLKRHTKRVANINAQGEEREMSAQWLAENGSEDAITGLLGRFGLTVDSQMKDAREKELFFDLLVELGPKVVPPTKSWLATHANIAIPLRILEHFDGRAAVVTVLLDLLALETDPFKTEKKRQLLIKLTEYKDERVAPAVIPLLADFDEGVRYAAAEALLAQDDLSVVVPLAKAMAEPEEESNRFRVRIAEAFQQKRWTLGDHAAAVAARPPVGWRVVDERMVQA